MIVTVIGGSGFVGSRLCQRLKNKKKINFEILDKLTSYHFPDKVRIADIRFPIDESIIGNSSALINLAAEHHDNVIPRSLYHETNVQGARNICSVARKKNINKIIFTSSIAVYGFASPGTDESGIINPFSDYGRTKWEAEEIFKKWQSEDSENRTLVIIRPTVIFGESNRGNVFNLLNKIAYSRFVMIGNGLNRKSMAYVENVAAFLEYSLNFKPGVHLYNYIDKPDLTMNELIGLVRKILGRSEKITFRLPYIFGLAIGKFFDWITCVSRKKLAISSIRVKKFCTNSVYESAISKAGFVPPVNLLDAIERTVKYEFLEDHKKKFFYHSE